MALQTLGQWNFWGSEEFIEAQESLATPLGCTECVEDSEVLPTRLANNL